MKSDRVFGLGGRVAAVIGAGSGIGEAVAHGCARQGAPVCCLDVNGDAAAATAHAIAAEGGMTDAARLDITDATSVADALDHVVERHGGLDIVVSTPAVNVRKPILDYTDADFDRVVGLNLKGSFNVLRATEAASSSSPRSAPRWSNRDSRSMPRPRPASCSSSGPPRRSSALPVCG